MSLQRIYDELSAALSEESIDLAWSTATGLDGALSAIGLDAQGHLPLTRAQLSRGPDAVILTGSGSWRNFTWSTTLTGEEEASGANRFTLVLQGQDAERSWTFGTSFQDLSQTRRQRQSDGALVLGPSVLAGLVVEGPRVSVTADARSQRGAEAVLDLEPAPTYPVSDHLLEAPATGPGPRFEGWLRLQGSELEPYEGLLGGEQKLRLSGRLNFEPGAQLIELRAVAPGAELPVSPEGEARAGLSATEVGLRLESAYPDVYALEQPAAMSAAVLYAKVVLGEKDPVATEVSAPLLQNDDLWPLSVAISPPLTLPAILRTTLQLFGEEGEPGWLSFPLDLGLLSKFGLSGAELGIVPPGGDRQGGLSYASVQLRSSEEWDPPVPFVKVREIGTAWTFHWYDALFVTGNVSGKLTLLEGTSFEGIKLDLTATLPEFDLVARTEAPIAVPLGAMLEKYLGGKAGLEDSLKITEALVEASPTRQTYHATLMVDGIWKIELNKVTFSLDRILGEVMASQSTVSGSVTGFASVEVKSGSGPPTKPVFIVAAAYDGQGEGFWTFEGGLADGKLSLLDFAWGLFGSEPPSWLPTLDLTELWLTYATSAEHPYSARGTVVSRWKPELLGLELSLLARARYARRPRSDSATDLALTAAAPHRAELDGDVEMISEGELYGTFSVNRLTVTAGLSFVDTERNYLLEVAWGQAALRAVTVNVEDDGGGSHQAIEITLHDVTLGSLVEGLLRLANPNLDYRLEPPWDFLNSIDLSRFKMTIDPKLQTVTVTYAVALNLGFASLDSVGVRYDRSGGDPSVNFVLTGTLLGKDFRQKPLSWDAARESPPEVPGKGPRLFELRYLGLGQHVTLSDLTRYESVETVIAALRAEMQPPKKRDANPLTESGLRFEESSQWMLGLDCTVMDTVSLAIVMHDPDLYGLLVKLGGPEAKSLAGLEFELLYKRVTDTIGVFRVRLQVPDAFRQIMLGPVSLTLGQITVDIFTNGNFMVDLGFPHQRDFSNSFGLQAGPFIGSGGLYFGVLNGATSKRVPAIVNGTFDPVLELGLGISAGVGRTFEKGPLKAGLYVQMEAIFEGVLGWFAPTDGSAPRAMYYWAQGTAGLIGKLYGSVDFTVVRAAVSVEAHATVTVTVAAYRETLVELDVGVEVEAEIEIFWVSVSFSFSMDLHASFSIGESSTAPWILAADQSGRQLLADAVPRRRLGAAAVRALTRESFLLDRGYPATVGAEPPYHLNWRTDVEVFPDRQAHPVGVKLLPAFGVDQVPVSWPGRSPAAESSEYRIAFLGLIDNDSSPGSTGTAFDPLSEAMLRWALSALELDPVAGVVSAGQLEELMRQLEMPETMQQGFSMEKLGGFFGHNLELRLSAIPAGEPGPTDGAAFPIPPPLGWDCPESTGDERRFAEYRKVDSVYEREVGEYFAELDPRQGGSQAASAAEAGDGGETESLATFVFRDWFLMVAKAAVQAALDVIAAFPYRLAEGSTESPAAVCAHFDPVPVFYEKHLGDTVDQLAQALGMGLGELLALNPKIEAKLSEAAVGGEVEVLVGATPAGVAGANPGRPLVAGKTVPLGDLVHQVRDGETLKEIAGRLGASLEPWLKSEALLDSRLLLRPGAPLPLPAASFANVEDLDLKTVAALLYVRLRGTTDLHAADAQGVPLVDWYAAAITSKNGIPQEGPLPETLEVPKAYDDFSEPKTWKTLPGDTAWRVAATLALAQNPVTDAGFEKWLGEVTALNPGSGPFQRLALPAAMTAIEPGETLRGLAQRLPLELPDTQHSGQGLGEAASFQRIVEAAPVLAPLQPLTVPACTGTTQGGDTLSSFAQRYDLSLEDLGSRVATQSGLLAFKQGEDLKVPHPASAKIGAATGGTDSPFEPWELVPAVLRTHGGKIAAQVSRFLLHGLRMPAPEKGSDGHYHPTGPKAGLFELTGQQLVGPAPVSGSDPATDRMVLEVKVFDPAASWLKLYESAAAGNGAVALTDPVQELVVRITEGDLARYPARRLQHVFSASPGPLPLVRATPVRHGLQQRILWQSTEAVALPNPGHAVEPVVGEKTIWPFSSDLRRAAVAYSDEAFALRRTDPGLGPAAQPVELSGFAWASAVALRVRRIPGQSNTYQLLGAGADGRADLLGLWRYLHASGDSAGLHLLTKPSAGSGLPNGLASVPPLDAETFLVKTNLSTRTVAPEASAMAGPAPTFGEYYARLTDSQRFLTLLWEGSVVGGAGYWLHYATADGSGLPESIFGDDGSGEVTLLALLGTQTSEPPSRRLHPFTNCAVVGESIDAAASSLFAAAAGGAETSLQATVAPGSVGFEMALEKPAKGAADSQSALRRLYSLAGYGLDKAGPFKGSQNPGLPVGPQVPAVSGAGKKAGDDRIWDLFQVVPISRFAERSPAPEAPGLPPAAEDPYAGIEGSNGGSADAQVTVSFHDVLGNSSLESGKPEDGGPLPLSLPVGYTDPVIGVGAWPATASSFRVAPASSGEPGARLVATLALQASGHVAAPGQRGSAAAAEAAKQLDRFRSVYYQLLQPDMTAALLTTLEQEAGEPVRTEVPLDGLWRFAAGSCAWLGTAAALIDFEAGAGAGTKLSEIVERAGVGFDQLAAANATVALEKILAGATIPTYVPFREGATPEQLCPDPSRAAALLCEAENASLPLREGVEVVIPAHPVTVPPDPSPPTPPPTLRELAAANGITLASLAKANEKAKGLLRVGAEFTCEGVRVEVTKEFPEVSLEDVAKTFNDQGVHFDAVMVAGANADATGALRPGARLEIDRAIALAGETLAANHTGVDLGVLARENTKTPDLFPAGAPLFVSADPADAETMRMELGRAAKLWALAPEQLLRHNGGVALAAGATIALPGQAALPSQVEGLRVPYRIPHEATLAGIALLFAGADQQSLAGASEALPGVVAGGKTIEVGGKSVQTQDGDSLADVRRRFDPEIGLRELVAAIGARPGYLAEGALLLCPPAILPAAAPSTLAAASARYGLDAPTLAGANAALAGIVVPGAEVKLSVGEETVAVSSGPADTLNSLVWRFGQKGVSTTVGEIAAANPDVPLLRAGATILLSPKPCELSAPVGATAAGWRFPEAIFPLQAWLELSRDPKLLDPSVRREEGEGGPVTRDRAALAANATPAKDRALALEGFARECQGSVPALRVATGKVEGVEEADVWAVVFDRSHIAKVAIEPPAEGPGGKKLPQFYALAPLVNSLVSRTGVPIAPLGPEGKPGDPKPTDYQGIDLESWARRLLADVDLFVSAPYATALYQAGEQRQLEAVLGEKAKLAQAIAEGLDYVLELGQPQRPARQVPPPPDWSSAVETLRQRLLDSLAGGYATEVIAQYRAQVESPWQSEQARLVGAAKLPAEPTDEQRRARVSAAKASLATGTSFVEFPVDVTEEGQQRSVRLPLEYAIGEIELNIADVVSGYQSSDWLSLITPFEPPPSGVTLDLGEPDVPLPLRAYPSLPALVDQTATPTMAKPKGYEEALHWDCTATFQHQSMATDQLQVEVEFNRPPQVGLDSPGQDLFAALAQYVAVAPELWEILGALPSAKLPIDPRLQNAVDTFAGLVGRIASAWAVYWKPPAEKAGEAVAVNEEEKFSFTATPTPRFDPVKKQWYWEKLLLSRDRSDLPWPQLSCFASGGPAQPMKQAGEGPKGMVYEFPQGEDRIEAFGTVGYAMSFKGLHVATYQNATSRISVVRNAQLLDDGPRTRDSFVYRTPAFAFAGVTTPLLSWTDAFSIGKWSEDAASSPLAPVLRQMLGGNEKGTISCEIRYGYELGGDPDDPLISELPVAYRPSFDYSSSTVGDVIDVVRRWKEEQKPAEAGGEWIFGLSLYSAIDGDLGRPLLELRRLRSRIEG